MVTDPIRIIREPAVYLLGRQTVDDAELDRFLADNGVTWESDSEVAAEVLVETAGRTCYMSFAKPRPGGNAAYIGHILDTSHGSVTEHAVWNFLFTGVSRSLTHELIRHRAGWGYCLAGDTMIHSGSQLNGRFNGCKKKWAIKQLYDMNLTPHGRSRLKLVTVRCFDGERFVKSKLKGVTISGVKDILRVRLRDGKAIRCSADHLFMTPDGWRRAGDLQPGQELATNGVKAIGIPRDWLEKKYRIDNVLISDIATEVGCSTHTIRKYIRIHGLQKPMGMGALGREPPNKGKRYTLGWHHTEETRKLLAEQKRAEKNARWLGRGASAQAGRLRAQKLYAQQPCRDCGGANGHRHHLDRDTLSNAPENIYFVCPSCHTKLHYQEDGPTCHLTVKWVAIDSILPDGREVTYDLEVDHPAHNFVANGIVTHNSQLSQRYVDESVAEYVEPDVIANDPLAHGMWLEAVTKSHYSYSLLADYLARKLAYQCSKCGGPAQLESLPCACAGCGGKALQGTELKKAARQAARSVLPNATETKIFCTANARSIRWFLEERGSAFADPEIRRLANRLHDVMVKESSALFGDFKRTRLPDGTDVLTPDNRKV